MKSYKKEKVRVTNQTLTGTNKLTAVPLSSGLVFGRYSSFTHNTASFCVSTTYLDLVQLVDSCVADVIDANEFGTSR